MQPLAFTAVSAEAAVAQIRAQLGPEAIVLNVRPLPLNGLARLWQKPMIEVIACAPEPVAEPLSVSAAISDVSPISEALADFRQQLQEIRQQVEIRAARPETISPGVNADALAGFPTAAEGDTSSEHGSWRVAALLQKGGLLPLHVQRVLDQLCLEFGETAPATLAEEITLAQGVLSGFWKNATSIAPHSLHALIGPAGSGKTTSLCKWLTQTSLVEGRSAKVWRIDGATANMAESLSIYAEILGVPSERTWETNPQPLSEEIGFIDLPGVDWRKPLAIKELGGQLKNFGAPKLHLVLNGAYDISILLAQVRAFSGLPIEDLIVTHLDEETRWGKLWNLALGTSHPIRHFSTGQNIPGDFQEASAAAIFARQFPRK